MTKDDGWRLNELLWKEIEVLLAPRKRHPLGCHNPRVPDRDAMNAILFVLRTGYQWIRAGGNRHLLMQLGIPALSGMDGCRGVRGALADGADEVRRTQRD